MRLGYEGFKYLQAPIKKGSLEGASTYNVKLGGHNVLDKNTGEIQHHYSPLGTSS